MSRQLRRALGSTLLASGVLVLSGASAHASAPAQGGSRTDTSRVAGGGTGAGKTSAQTGPGTPADPQVPGDKVPPLEPKGTDPKGVGKPVELAEPSPPRDAPRAPTSEVDDRSSWETWWLYNREALLDLRRHVHGPGGAAAAPSAPGGDGPTVASSAVVSNEVRERRVLPALERLIQNETNPALLGAALIAFARSASTVSVDSAAGASSSPGSTPASSTYAGSEPSARAALVQRMLAHPQTEVSESAALALGILGETHALRALLALARDTAAGSELCGRDSVPYRLRSFAAYGAGLLAAHAANEDVRRYAAGGLLVLTDGRDVPRDVQVAAVSALGLVVLASRPETWQANVNRTAKVFEPTASCETLVAHLAGLVERERAGGVVRAHALTALVRLAAGAAPEVQDAVEKRCIGLLQPAAHEPNELVQSAALGLAQLADAGDAPQDRAARESLMGAAREADLDTRHFALLALGELAARPDEDVSAPFPGTADVHRFLLRELLQGRGAMRSFAALGLGLSGHGLRAQGRTPSSEAARALEVRFAKAGTPDEVAACALALALRGERAALEPVRGRLAEAADDLTRSGCAMALGLGRVSEARTSLKRLCLGARARPALLREASIALVLLDDPHLTKDLCAELALAPGSAAQAAFLQALAHVGDARALDALLAWSADTSKSADLRARAVTALGAVCDPRPLPWNDGLARGANYLAEAETLTNPRGTGVLDRR